MALVGSKAGCFSFALFGFFGFLFGCGTFCAVGFLWVLGCFLDFWLGYLGILSCVFGGALRFFDIYNITYKKKGLVHDWKVDIVSSLVNILYFVRLGQGMK